MLNLQGNTRYGNIYIYSAKLQNFCELFGIGLSMWRVNLGAGTYEAGDASGIGHRASGINQDRTISGYWAITAASSARAIYASV